MNRQLLLLLLLLLVISVLYGTNGENILSRKVRQTVDLSQTNLSSLGDNSLFTTWRPTFHFASPNSWMNDPCAPLYNPTTEMYHLYYQVQPGSVEWGNISWGHAKSSDMIFWEDVTSWQGYDYVALAPGLGNNQSVLGVFTGSGLPVAINGSTTNGTITIIYTSVKYLPISWNGFYQTGSETQSLAVSYDDGITYQEYSNNPILPTPPTGWNVTGWRDPKFEQWTQMDLFLYGSNQGNYYMTISSGIRGVGPRLTFYQASSTNLANWTYLGPLLAVDDNYTVSQIWSGSLGFNFEVSNVFSLVEKPADGGDNQTIYHFATLGTEGGNTTLHSSAHWSVWIQGNLTTSNGSVSMNIGAGGVSDWGDTYALNSFQDTVNDRRIFYGWVMEANNNYGERAFGYNGQITLPREVFVQVYKNVVNVSGSIAQPGPWIIIPNGNGTFTCKTLGIRPIIETSNLRQNSTLTTPMPQTFNQTTNFTTLNVSSISFELQVTINISSNTTAGFVFRRSSNGLEYTTLYYDPVAQYLILNRTCSSMITQFTNTTIYAKHALLTTINSSNITQTELLSLHMFVDNSLIEIYANNRTAIATHIYPALSDSTALGYFVGGRGGSVTFTNLSIWTNLQNAFPNRPTNSSITLLPTSTTATSTSTITTSTSTMMMTTTTSTMMMTTTTSTTTTTTSTTVTSISSTFSSAFHLLFFLVPTFLFFSSF